MLERAPKQPRVWLSYGHMLKTVGRQAEGIAAYRRAIELQPTLGEAWWSLANLKTVKFDEDDLAAMQAGARRAASLSDEDRFHLDFALGKAMHDAGRTDEAFAHYAKGNALAPEAASPTMPASITRLVDRCIAAFTAEAFAERPAAARRRTRSSSSACRAPDRP